MATFEQRVEGITGIDIDTDTTPTQNELTEFLKDGVIEVTQRVLAIRPVEASEYMRVTTGEANDTVDIGGAKIISVQREIGVDGDWRECKQISPGESSRVTDSESLNFVSKYHPAFLITDQQHINVYPAPGSSNDGFRVYWVNNIPKGDGLNDLTYAHEIIAYFPVDKVYLVVTYAAIKSMEAKLSELTLQEEDVELAQSLVTNIATLKDQYNSALTSLDPQRAKVQRNRETQGARRE